MARRTMNMKRNIKESHLGTKIYLCFTSVTLDKHVINHILPPRFLLYQFPTEISITESII